MRTFKFVLDNQRLTAKMWEKVVQSGQVDRDRGTGSGKRGAGGNPTQKHGKQPDPTEFDQTLRRF